MRWSVGTILVAILALPAIASAQQSIVETGAQHHPIVNFQGNIIYRSGPSATNPHILLWRADWTSPPLVLDGGFALPSTIPGQRDGLFSAITETGGYFLRNLTNSSGDRGATSLLVETVGVEFPPARTALGVGGGRPEFDGLRRRHLAAIDGSDWYSPTMAWSEYRLGGWDVIFVKDRAALIFDSGFDDLEPTIAEYGGASFVAWTSRRDTAGVGAGKFGAMVKRIDGYSVDTIWEMENIRHARFAKTDAGDPPALVFYREGGGLEYVVFDWDGNVMDEGELHPACSTPRRPVASWRGGKLYVAYACYDHGATAVLGIHGWHGICDVDVDDLGHIPSEHRQVEYDLAGDHLVFSKYVGPGAEDFDIHYEDISVFCP